jgi:opacity protein-like surface antigen
MKSRVPINLTKTMENILMKTLLLTTSLIVALGTASYASDFNNAEFNVVVTHDAFEFGLDTTANDGFGSAYVNYSTLDHSLGLGESNLTFGVEYLINPNLLAFSVAHNTTLRQNNLAFTVSPQFTYLSDAITLRGSDILFEPTVGISYDLNQSVSLFGNVQYTWNASNSWTRSGGEATVGVDLALASNVTVTPYVTHAFDTPNTNSQIGFRLGLAF